MPHSPVGLALLCLMCAGCARNRTVGSEENSRGADGAAHAKGGASTASAPAKPHAVPVDASASTEAGAQRETAVLAGGCFWGMEEILRTIPGVLTTDVGYTGGREGVTYEDMHDDRTGNAEAVRVVFDPARLSYESLLRDWFFRMHDPTTANRQGNDVGAQYRSVIFVTSATQRRTAEEVKAQLDASGAWGKPIVTEILDARPFTLAEEYHQDYLQKDPGGYTCHYLRDLPQVH